MKKIVIISFLFAVTSSFYFIESIDLIICKSSAKPVTIVEKFKVRLGCSAHDIYGSVLSHREEDRHDTTFYRAMFTNARNSSRGTSTR